MFSHDFDDQIMLIEELSKDRTDQSKRLVSERREGSVESLVIK